MQAELINEVRSEVTRTVDFASAMQEAARVNLNLLDTLSRCNMKVFWLPMTPATLPERTCSLSCS